MTKNEAIEELKAIKSAYSDKGFHEARLMKSEEKALDMAITALEQPCETSTDEPMTMVYPTIFCEDAISRSELMNDILTNFDSERCDYTAEEFLSMVCKAPSVQLSIHRDRTVQDFVDKCRECGRVRKGHWIRKEDDMCWWDECSECGLKPLKGRFTNDDILSNFCPNCGADMRGDTDANSN